MDPGWDHTENEDKHLLTQVIGMSTVKDQHIYVSTGSIGNTGGGGGCGSGTHELVSLSGESTKHLLSIASNILNTNQNSLSSLNVQYIGYFYHVFPLHPNTFHQLFQHSTQPQLDQLKNFITEFHKLNEVVDVTLASLTLVMVYLAVAAYDVFVYLVYLLTSILGFNLLQEAYVQEVKTGLEEFMTEISAMLVESSVYLYGLMNILILHFCDLINNIFKIIEAKLLFYLYIVNSFIVVDTLQLSVDLSDMKLLLLELKLLSAKYKLILESVRELLKKLNKLLPTILGNFAPIFSGFNKLINKVLCNLKSICSICGKLTGISCCLTQQTQQSNESCNGDNLTNNIILTWEEKSNHKVKVSITNINPSLITTLQTGLESIKKLLGVVDIVVSKEIKSIIGRLKYFEIINKLDSGVTVLPLSINLSFLSKFQKGFNYISKLLEIADKVASKEINSIIGQLHIAETINLPKLYILLARIQLKYLEILIRIDLLICTLLFYNEIQPTIKELFNSLKFESCNVSQFLSKSSEVEQQIKSISQKINDCIKKLATVCNQFKGCKLRKELLQLYVDMINRIVLMKFYVDLIAREIIIFKTIIHTLIVMSVSSSIIDALMSEIAKIADIDKAIPALIVVHEYLRAFYFIQLENSLTIFALSSKLRFSGSIHENYHVLLANLYWINRLIWAVECFINHLIVFKYVTKGLNSLIEDIAKQLQIITHVKNVAEAMATITNKLDLIKNSIGKLNEIQKSMDITKWKEKAQRIREETKSINSNVAEINSQIDLIKEYVDSLLKSFATLLGIYYYLLVLMDFVFISILYTNNRYRVEMGIGNKYYRGVIMSVLGPCNKQLMFILGYLIVMWLYVAQLINIVGSTVVLIEIKTAWLKVLTQDIKSNVDEINKGVEDMECAIEGVALRLIQCTLQSLTNNTIHSNVTGLGPDKEYVLYSLTGITGYNSLVNRMLEFWTFSDESVELFKYIRFCLCALHFESRYRAERPSAFHFYSLHSIKTTVVNPVSELRRATMAENVGNHLCLCLVIKYHLRPALLKCILFLRNEELGPLDTISRKFHRYNSLTRFNHDLWRLCALLVRIIYEITSFLRNRYKFVWIRSFYPAEIKCFCTDTNTIDYHPIVSVMLVISWMVENIWTMDPETIRMSIDSLSTLMSEFERIDSPLNTHSVVCSRVYSMFVHKECKDKAPGKCCCWCVTCYNLLIMCVSLCLQCKLCKAICNNAEERCEKVKNFCEVKECDCKCPPANNGVCCLLKLATCAQPGTKETDCQDLQNVLEKCCKTCTDKNGCCCKTLSEKVKSGLCKLLLLGCECECQGAQGEDECKVKCLLFENMDGCRSVAVVIFCKCKAPKPCCCLTQLVEKFKEKSLDKICEDCKCEDLKGLCDEICGKDCEAHCVCTKLKSEVAKICPNDNNCLCKELKQCLKKCAQGTCPCKNKGCCKILAQSVRLLVRACRANVLEPHKRIAIELLNCSSNKKEIVKRIVNSINNGTINKISLVKNTSNSYNRSNDMGVKDASTTNWGYDTQYEHEVTTDNSYKGDGYPYLACITNKNYGNLRSSKRFFKMKY